ncbi:hypothetical protein N9L68_00600 [bacterium]|nr:hypothetical protein [bacterium]
MRRQDPSQITGRHDPGGDWPGVSATAYNGLSPPRALGRLLCAVWIKQHTAEEDLTRRWAFGPANYYYYCYGWRALLRFSWEMPLRRTPPTITR